MEDAVSYEKLYFKMAEKYFATEKLLSLCRLKIFLKLNLFHYQIFRTFTESFQIHHSAFFMMQLFQEVVKTFFSELAITNALEELLFNCSAKVLKSDEKLLSFTHMKIFTNAFLSVMNRDIDQNVLDSTRERSNYDKNLRKTFVSKAAGSKEEIIRPRTSTEE